MPISPAYKDILYYSNDSRTKSYTITDGNGDPVDLSGDTLTLTVKKKKSGDVVAALSTASEITISGANNNTVSILFNNDFEERSYYYDLYNNTEDQTIMYGRLIVTEEVHE